MDGESSDDEGDEVTREKVNQVKSQVKSSLQFSVSIAHSNMKRQRHKTLGTLYKNQTVRT